LLVKMRALVSGLRDGQPWPPVGGTVEVSDDEAETLLRNRLAEPVFDPESGVERAVAPSAETRKPRQAKV
jgi:hypothetical protein